MITKESIAICKISLFILAFSCFWSCDQKDPTKSQSPPNIVLIFTDDQGYEDLSCFGSPDIRTPNIDRLAKEGVKFTNFYVAHPICSASRGALMTGCYANRLGIFGAYGPDPGRGLNPNEETIAEILKPLNYKTAIYGKWHLGNEGPFLPTEQGFDEYFGIPYSNDMWPYHPWQGTVFNFPPLRLMENEKVIDTLDDQSQITTQYTERAVSFINKNKDNPFFLYVPHSMPHVPLFVSDKFKGKSPRGLYGDVIEEIDWGVGEIMKALETNGLTENTLVIFTSDNGPWLSYGGRSGEAHPLREGKGTALEGGVRVPCVMRWPDGIEPGQVKANPMMSIDILPTIAKITGASLPSLPIDGRDASYLFENKSITKIHHDAYFYYYHKNQLEGMLSGDGRWKMYFPHKYRSLDGKVGTDDGLPIDYVNFDMGLELYDLQNDISETNNVASQHPEVVADMEILADAMRADLGDNLTEVEAIGARKIGLLEDFQK